MDKRFPRSGHSRRLNQRLVAVEEMKKVLSDIDVFVKEFRADKRGRERLVGELVKGAGRLTLNLPRQGLARQIADRLREGPFSDYYEFEKLLARSLHPLMAGLNLNVVSDLQVNGLFSERYLVYSRELNAALASGGKLTAESIRSMIVAMAAREGHYMVIKFYDLVLRGIDAGLYRSLKPVEEAVIRMKRDLGDDEAANRSRVGTVYRALRDGRGPSMAGLLKKRMEWDDVLRAYGAGLEDHGDAAAYEEGPSGAAAAAEPAADWDEAFSDEDEALIEEEDTAKPPLHHDRGDVITGYARLIKRDYLDVLDPRDEEKIRGVVRGIYIKNEMVYDSERAADVVREVIDIWLADHSLDDGVRSILLQIADEEAISSAPEDEYSADEASLDIGPEDETITVALHRGEGDAAAGVTSEETGMPEDTGEPPEPSADVPGDGGVSDNELDALLAEGIETVPAGESRPLPDEMSVADDTGISGEEMRFPAEDEAGEPADMAGEEAPFHEGDAAAGEGVSDGEMEALLAGISDDNPAVREKKDPLPEAVPGDSVSGGEFEELLSTTPGEAPAGDMESFREPDKEESEIAGVSGGELDALLADISAASPDETGRHASAAGTEDDFEPVPYEKMPDDQESFEVKDEILFEDRSLVKKAPVTRVKPQKPRISMRDIADTESRKNLLDLVEILAKTGSAADVSRYLVGAGVTPAVKYGVTDLIGCNDFEEAFDRITGSEIFDYNEKIIILEKWLKIIGLERGWFQPPHESGLQRITGEIEAYAAEIRDGSAGEDNEYLLNAGNAAPGTAGDTETGPTGETAPVEIREKEMLKTGDESIRLSREIYEFQSLYRAGAGKRTIGKRVPGIQEFFDHLAAGGETSVHFAVYHNRSFVDFLSFIDNNPGLKEMLDIDAAVEYCKKKKII